MKTIVNLNALVHMNNLIQLHLNNITVHFVLLLSSGVCPRHAISDPNRFIHHYIVITHNHVIRVC